MTPDAKKKRTGLPVLLLVCIGSLCLAGIVFVCWRHYDTGVRGSYDVNWGVRYGNNLQELYYQEDDHGFHGDGDRYSVWYTGKDLTLPDSHLAASGKNYQTSAANQKFIRTIYQQLSVPQKYRIRSDSNTWRRYTSGAGMDHLLIVTDQTGLVYVFESLT